MYILLTHSEVSIIDNVLQDYDLIFDKHIAFFVEHYSDLVDLFDISRGNLVFLKNVLIQCILSNPSVLRVYDSVMRVLYPDDVYTQHMLDYHAKLLNH